MDAKVILFVNVSKTELNGKNATGSVDPLMKETFV